MHGSNAAQAPRLNQLTARFSFWTLRGRTPEEAWQGVELPEPIPIRATHPDEIVVQVQRRSHRGESALAMITIRVERKEAA